MGLPPARTTPMALHVILKRAGGCPRYFTGSAHKTEKNWDSSLRLIYAPLDFHGEAVFYAHSRDNNRRLRELLRCL